MQGPRRAHSATRSPRCTEALRVLPPPLPLLLYQVRPHRQRDGLPVAPHRLVHGALEAVPHAEALLLPEGRVAEPEEGRLGPVGRDGQLGEGGGEEGLEGDWGEWGGGRRGRGGSVVSARENEEGKGKEGSEGERRTGHVQPSQVSLVLHLVVDRLEHAVRRLEDDQPWWVACVGAP